MEVHDTSDSKNMQLFDLTIIEEFIDQKSKASGVFHCPECDSTWTYATPGTHAMKCWACGAVWLKPVR